jgi:hypothetical protein
MRREERVAEPRSVDAALLEPDQLLVAAVLLVAELHEHRVVSTQNPHSWSSDQASAATETR